MRHLSPIEVKQSATPGNPANGYGRLYPKSDGRWYSLDPGGIEVPAEGARWARKLAAETRVNTAALASDADLKFDGVANGVYDVAMTLYMSVSGSSSTSDLKVALLGPTGCTFGGLGVVPDLAIATNVGSTDFSPWSAGTTASDAAVKGIGLGPTTTTEVHLSALVIFGSTAGTLNLRWAQNAAVNVTTTMQIGSRLRYERIA